MVRGNDTWGPPAARIDWASCYWPGTTILNQGVSYYYIAFLEKCKNAIKVLLYIYIISVYRTHFMNYVYKKHFNTFEKRNSIISWFTN